MTPPFRFALALSMKGRAGDVSVNDVPVWRNYSGDRIDTALPVTEWIAEGTNTVKWDLFVDNESAIEGDARARATLRAQPWAGGEWRDLMTVVIDGPIEIDAPPLVGPETSPLGEVSASALSINGRTRIASLSRSVALKVAMPRWAWTAAPPVADNDAVLASLVSWYQGLHGALVANNRTAIVAALREKTQELAAATGMSEPAMLAEIGLADVPTDPKWQLSTPDWGQMMIERAAGNRLIRLFHPEDGSAIVYRSASGLYRSFEFWLRQAPENWVMTR